MRNERDFYFSKLRDIDHLLEMNKDLSLEIVTAKIREIMYSPPEKVVLILEDGNIKLKPKEEFSNV